MFRSGGVWAGLWSSLIDSLALTGFPAVSASGPHLSLSVSAWAHLNVPHHTYHTHATSNIHAVQIFPCSLHTCFRATLFFRCIAARFVKTERAIVNIDRWHLLILKMSVLGCDVTHCASCFVSAVHENQHVIKGLLLERKDHWNSLCRFDDDIIAVDAF